MHIHRNKHRKQNNSDFKGSSSSIISPPFLLHSSLLMVPCVFLSRLEGKSWEEQTKTSCRGCSLVTSRIVMDVDLQALSGHACIHLITPAPQRYTLSSVMVVLGRQAVQPLLERRQMLK